MPSTSDVGKSAVQLVTEVVRRGDSSSKLLEVVRTRFDGDEDAEDALTRLESNPADAAAITALERVLVLRLVRDLAFFERVERLVHSS
jgi:hypothetical protein